MRIVIDLDGTICALRKHNEDYADVLPNPGVAAKLHELKQAGHHIVIHSARHMKSCDGDVSLVEQKIGQKTREWLKRYGIPYDELCFGKPYAHIYIDDLALPFRGWNTIETHDLDEQKINVLIPMAGRGSRFAEAGFTDPKPLIKTKGKTMIEWAMQSFGFLPKENVQFIFVILKEHDEKFSLHKHLIDIFGEHIKVVVTDSVTRGQAETCLLAKDLIDNYNKLFIFNCDTFSQTPNLYSEIMDYDPEGLLVCFEANDPRYSFAKLDAYGYVCETAEKRPISNYASNGMYYFKHGHLFVQAAEAVITEGAQEQGEFYIAPLYNRLIALGKRVRISLVKENWILGTPEELARFEKQYEN